MIAALGDYGVEAGLIDGLTGVWVGRAAARGDARKIGSIGIHVRKGVTTHGLRRQRRQRPAAVRVGRPVRDRGLPDDLGHARAGRRAVRSTRSRRHASPRGFGEAYGRDAGRARSADAVLGSLTLERMSVEQEPARERIHVTRSRANPGGRDRRSRGSPFRERKPPWLKVPAPGGPTYRRLKKAIEADNLHTVCEEANCPNVGECWERGTATFMILGDVCTRRCGFCNVQTGVPTWNDPLEPLRVADQVKQMGLRHAVVTSVDRDDLPDYGAGGVRRRRSARSGMLAPECKVEVLTPDFRGQEMPLAKVIARAPRRLQPQRRDGAAPVPAGPPRLGLPALVPGAADRQGDGRRPGRDQVGPDGRAGRGLRRDGRGVRGPCASTGSRSSRSASTCARPSATCRSCATGTRTSSPP